MVTKYRNGVRITGGRWKGRKIAVSDLAELRPTADRIRETLFNWLQFRIDGAVCLDLFAGSGILSFEALSRGASSVVAVDSQQEVIDSLKKTRHLLGANTLQLVHDEAQRLLSTSVQTQFDIVFIDPPFNHILHSVVCKLLHENRWLAPTALVYIEAAKGSKLEYPQCWSVLKTKCSGNVQYMLLCVDD